MLNTRELVSVINNDYAPSWSREKILYFLDRALRDVYNHDCAQTVFLNSSDDTFPIPFLSTTDGTLEYIPSASNLLDSDGSAVSLEWNGYTVVPRRIRRVFVQTGNISTTYDNKFIGRDFDWFGINNSWARTERISFQEVPGVLYNQSGIQNARVVFAENPGTHTDKFYIEFYIGPVPLSSESIPMSIDADTFEMELINVVMGYIEDARNGSSQRLDKWRLVDKPRIRSSLNAGAQQRKPYVFPTREAL